MEDGGVGGCEMGFVDAGADGFDLGGDFLVINVRFLVLVLDVQREGLDGGGHIE